MSEASAASLRASVVTLAILWFAGADLRLTMLAVPPVLPLIHHDLAMSEKAVGALAGLPVLLLGLVALPGSLLIARLGARRAAIVALLVVAAASAARGLGPSLPVLFAMTFAMGAGVSVLQPALPSLVGEWFPRSPGFATAVYANGLLIGEAVPAALTIPIVLPLVGGSWEASFVVWSLPVAATAVLLALATPGAARPGARGRARWLPDWKSGDTWRLGLLQGGTGGLYFSTNAFIPDYLHAIGQKGLVSLALGALNAGQLPASLVILLWARSLQKSRVPFVAMPLVGVLGLLLLPLQVRPVAVLGAGIVGFACAFVLILTLALPPQLVAAREVHRLSAGMFAIGYSLSFLIPLLGGAVWDATRLPAGAFAGSAIGVAILFGAGLAHRPPRPLSR
ncbi:MAG TPA: MFS transporter [Stellaceae bacterium]|nr:MFS transporter [Stellaceae bacterium]